MKIKTILNKLINEIGDAKKIYKFNTNDIPKDLNNIADDFPVKKDIGIIRFKTDKNTDYIVKWEAFKLPNPNGYTSVVGLDMSFKIKDGSYSDVSNKFEMFSVLATIVKMISIFLKQNSKIKYLTFIPQKTSQEDSKEDETDQTINPLDTKRGKFYVGYFKKAFDNLNIPINITEKGDQIEIDFISVK